MKTAKKFGCEHLIVHPGSGKYAQKETCDKTIGPLVTSIEELSKEAEEMGLTIALENMYASKGIFRIGTTTAELRKLIKSISLRNLGICLDTGHANYNGLEAWMETMDAEDLLINLHINDNDGFNDEHKVPGEGSVNWPRFIKALKNVNYHGVLMLEIRGGNNVKKRLEESYRVSSKLLNS